MNTWLNQNLTKLDYTIRDIQQAVVLSQQFGPDVERKLIGIREAVENAALLIRSDTTGLQVSA
ncbi:MAG: hypothetical protein ABI612_06155 [Betaproteobacteria bacterium]